jgi:hypothetical protein
MQRHLAEEVSPALRRANVGVAEPHSPIKRRAVLRNALNPQSRRGDGRVTPQAYLCIPGPSSCLFRDSKLVAGFLEQSARVLVLPLPSTKTMSQARFPLQNHDGSLKHLMPRHVNP